MGVLRWAGLVLYNQDSTRTIYFMICRGLGLVWPARIRMWPLVMAIVMLYSPIWPGQHMQQHVKVSCLHVCHNLPFNMVTNIALWGEPERTQSYESLSFTVLY